MSSLCFYIIKISYCASCSIFKPIYFYYLLAKCGVMPVQFLSANFIDVQQELLFSINDLIYDVVVVALNCSLYLCHYCSKIYLASAIYFISIELIGTSPGLYQWAAFCYKQCHWWLLVHYSCYCSKIIHNDWWQIQVTWSVYLVQFCKKNKFVSAWLAFFLQHHIYTVSSKLCDLFY